MTLDSSHKNGGTTPRTGAQHALVIENLTKSYGGAVPVLEGLNIRIDPGEIVSIVGPSGVGKTTLLRCLAGLMPPTSGRVLFGDREITSPITELSIVFQDYGRSLMPWMRAGQNVAFPLEGRGVPKASRMAAADRYLTAVGLPGVAGKYPWQMSGGQQQRVAIARALAYESEILLMDEPFASVDAQTRFDLEDLVLKLRNEFDVSMLIVTHDIDEAVYLADRIVVLAKNPASVIDVVEVPFGRVRNQIDTRADPRFAEARSRILGQIRHTPEPGADAT
jgi:NitT/TauT family transport system ATP-binding protein